MLILIPVFIQIHRGHGDSVCDETPDEMDNLFGVVNEQDVPAKLRYVIRIQAVSLGSLGSWAVWQFIQSSQLYLLWGGWAGNVQLPSMPHPHPLWLLLWVLGGIATRFRICPTQPFQGLPA